MAAASAERVTRAQRQVHTREKLIATAERLFLADGYASTSLDRVAEEAGFSKGAVYSNFSGKEELCLAVLDGIHGQQIEAVLQAFSGGTDIDGRIDAFSAWAREGLGRPRWTALEVEFAAIARQSPYVAHELVKRHKAIRGVIAELVRSVLEDAGIEIAMTPDQAATVLLSLAIGLGAQRSLDPELDVDVFATTMRQLLRSAR